MENIPCPLCGNAKHMKKSKPLYGHQVCKKCYYAFANRRQIAFVIDVLSWRVVMLPVSFAIGFVLTLLGFDHSAIAGRGLGSAKKNQTGNCRRMLPYRWCVRRNSVD